MEKSILQFNSFELFENQNVTAISKPAESVV